MSRYAAWMFLAIPLVLFGCGQYGTGHVSSRDGRCLDSDGDSLCDADEIAAGMDPFNDDMDDDGWLDGYDSDSPIVAPEVAERVALFAQMFGSIFPDTGNNLSGDLPHALTKGGSVPAGLFEIAMRPTGPSLKYDASRSAVSENCSRWLRVDPLPNKADRVFFQILNVNEETGIGTFNIRVAGNPICMDGTMDPRAPLTWQLSKQPVRVKIHEAPQGPRFKSVDGGLERRFRNEKGMFSYIELIATRPDFVNREAIVFLGMNGNDVPVDPGFFGIKTPGGYAAQLFGKRRGCESAIENGKLTFQFMVMWPAYVDAETAHRRGPGGIVVFEPRYPVIGGQAQTRCTELVFGEGASTGWKMYAEKGQPWANLASVASKVVHVVGSTASGLWKSTSGLRRWVRDRFNGGLNYLQQLGISTIERLFG